jgi:hypothetical protein
MLIESVPKKEEKPGEWISHNFDKTYIQLTKNEAVELIQSLVSFLYVGPNKYGTIREFVDGLWEEKRVYFVIYDEEPFIKMRQELRNEKEK